MARRIDRVESIRDQAMNRRPERSVEVIVDCGKTDAVGEVSSGRLIPQRIENTIALGRCGCLPPLRLEVQDVPRLLQQGEGCLVHR